MVKTIKLFRFLLTHSVLSGTYTVRFLARYEMIFHSCDQFGDQPRFRLNRLNEKCVSVRVCVCGIPGVMRSVC